MKRKAVRKNSKAGTHQGGESSQEPTLLAKDKGVLIETSRGEEGRSKRCYWGEKNRGVRIEKVASMASQDLIGVYLKNREGSRRGKGGFQKGHPLLFNGNKGKKKGKCKWDFPKRVRKGFKKDTLDL